jgi:hypothetical protein
MRMSETLSLPKVQEVLERLHTLADDVTLFPDQLAEYLAYIRDPANGFVSVCIPLGDGIEYSVKW